MMSYAHRVDGNQTEIVDALRRCGVAVVDLSAVGHGVPDLLCADMVGTFLVEVKTAEGRLRRAQADFRDMWPGDVYVVRSVEEALNIALARRSGVIAS